MPKYPPQSVAVHGEDQHDSTVLSFTPYNGKIADITEADTNKHTVDISAHVPVNCVSIRISATRMAGANGLWVYPNEGTTPNNIHRWDQGANSIAIISQRFEYALLAANADFDVFMFGYETEG